MKGPTVPFRRSQEEHLPMYRIQTERNCKAILDASDGRLTGAKRGTRRREAGRDNAHCTSITRGMEAGVSGERTHLSAPGIRDSTTGTRDRGPGVTRSSSPSKVAGNPDFSVKF